MIRGKIDMSLTGRRAERSDSYVITGECDEGTAVRRLIRRSRRSLTVTLTGPGRFTEAVLQHLALTPHPVAVQILSVAGFADDLAKRFGEIPAPYRDVRVSDSDLRGVLVADGVTALVPAPTGAAALITPVNISPSR